MPGQQLTEAPAAASHLFHFALPLESAPVHAQFESVFCQHAGHWAHAHGQCSVVAFPERWRCAARHSWENCVCERSDLDSSLRPDFPFDQAHAHKVLRACITFGEKASAAKRLQHTLHSTFCTGTSCRCAPKKGEFCTLHSYQTFCTKRLVRKRLA